MPQVKAERVERVLDEGQWFERGTRADFFEAGRPGHTRLEPAALGSYEVLRCERVETEGVQWLDVTLRPFGLIGARRPGVMLS
jgi:hypothetical protein